MSDFKIIPIKQFSEMKAIAKELEEIENEFKTFGNLDSEQFLRQDKLYYQLLTTIKKL